MKHLNYKLLILLVFKCTVLFPQNINHDSVIIYCEHSDMKTYLWQPGDRMPKGEGISFRTNYDINSYSGNTCIKLGFNANIADWIGINWLPTELSLKNEGINLFEVLNLSIGDEVRVFFYARGENGNEKIKCEVGGNHDFDDSIEWPVGTKKKWIELDTLWNQYSIDLSKEDLSNMVTGFAIFIESDKNFGNDIVHVYIDNIVIRKLN